nr:hypothetical protein [Tanacetum cinerariifolium]
MLDEENTVIINKTSLVVRGYRQEEGIGFEKSFALEDVYVCQPEGFIDVVHARHVYKLKKELYGLKQASRAWHDELSKFLLQNYFSKGTIVPTMFIRRFNDDILVLQNVDDGEMTFFLGLQVNQSTHGIFIKQSNYVLEILKKYRMETCDPIGTLMETKNKLYLDKNGTPVDATKYQSMIGALMYLTSSRQDIVHATCLCTRSDHAGCQDSFKSTSEGTQFLGEKLADYQLADIFTKALSVDQFNYLVRRIGMEDKNPMDQSYGFETDSLVELNNPNQLDGSKASKLLAESRFYSIELVGSLADETVNADSTVDISLSTGPDFLVLVLLVEAIGCQIVPHVVMCHETNFFLLEVMFTIAPTPNNECLLIVVGVFGIITYEVIWISALEAPTILFLLFVVLDLPEVLFVVMRLADKLSSSCKELFEISYDHGLFFIVTLLARYFLIT